MIAYVVTIEDETGNRVVYGPFSTFNAAQKVYEMARKASASYTGDPADAEWDVSIDALRPCRAANELFTPTLFEEAA